MHVPVLRQTCTCCHGAAIADKRRGERIAQKHAV
jgi:predicted CXXCH cytochrome family protein